MEEPFIPSLFVDIRKRMGQSVFDEFQRVIIDAVAEQNLRHIKKLLEHWPEGTEVPLPQWLMYRYWVIQHVYRQQRVMYKNKVGRCDDRIVSISQPYVRPIIRGKLDKSVEFGSKLSASLNGDGIACIDEFRWDAFNEGNDLKDQVEAYRERMGCYPEVVCTDPVYGNRVNRAHLKKLGIRFAGKPLGRPRKETEANREELKRQKHKGEKIIYRESPSKVSLVRVKMDTDSTTFGQSVLIPL